MREALEVRLLAAFLGSELEAEEWKDEAASCELVVYYSRASHSVDIQRSEANEPNGSFSCGKLFVGFSSATVDAFFFRARIRREERTSSLSASSIPLPLPSSP
jgi:hypothetical protein